VQIFNPDSIKNLYRPSPNSSKGENGMVTIIGGSKLFHGAPLLALTTASKILDMVFFASPDPSIGEVANQIKSKLFSFIWIPWQETGSYIEKSDAVLVGPGLMRYRTEGSELKDGGMDAEGKETKEITETFLKKFPDKKWVIDAGSLQTLDTSLIPENAVLTPNLKEYKMLFGDMEPNYAAKKYKCILVIKGVSTFVYSQNDSIEITGGNAGLTKGGSGDVQAGLTVSLLAKNEPFPAATSASFIVKKTADQLFEKVGTNYSSDDLAAGIPETLAKIQS